MRWPTWCATARCVRSVLSEVSAATLRRAHAVHPIAAVQTEYSLWTRQAEIAVLDACREIGAAFVAFSPLARGVLTGTVREPGAFDAKDIRRAMPRFAPDPFAANLRLVDALADVAREAGCSPAQLALAWLLSLIAQQVLLSTARAAGLPVPSPDTAATLAAGVAGCPCGHGTGHAHRQRLGPDARDAAQPRPTGRPAALGLGPAVDAELLASLPVAGLDGTLARQPARFGAAAGRAHLKTGSLRDVVALAGIVDAPSGRRWVLVAVIIIPGQGGRGVLEAVLRWVAQTRRRRRRAASRRCSSASSMNDQAASSLKPSTLSK